MRCEMGDLTMTNKPMRVLLLNGSPRREHSSTLTVAEAFTAGLCEAAGAESETVAISSLHITPCRGCFSCWSRTEGSCMIQNDDAPKMKQKLLDADVVIASFPLYFFGMPGQVKVFVDRMLSMLQTYRGHEVPPTSCPAHSPRYARPNQKFVLISGCAYTESERVFDALLAQLDLIFGAGRYTAVTCPQLMTLVEMGGARLERRLARFTEAGKEFARRGNLTEETLRGLTKPPFSPEVYRVILEQVWKRRTEHWEEFL